MLSTSLFIVLLAVATSADCASDCEFIPSTNATKENYPGSPTSPYYNASVSYPFDLNSLDSVPIASVCTSGNRTAELACARSYIDAIDEQLAFLYARRLGYAAVAGDAKYATNTSLNDPSRNDVVAAGMAAKVLKYGATEDAGRTMGGEGCMIYAALEYEVAKIQSDCDPNFTQDVERVCE